jgi:hypothetical protein
VQHATITLSLNAQDYHFPAAFHVLLKMQEEGAGRGELQELSRAKLIKAAVFE